MYCGACMAKIAQCMTILCMKQQCEGQVEENGGTLL